MTITDLLGHKYILYLSSPGNVINWGNISYFSGIRVYQSILGYNSTFEMDATIPGLSSTVTIVGSTNWYPISSCGECQPSLCEDTSQANPLKTYSYVPGIGETISTVPGYTTVPSGSNLYQLDQCGCGKIFEIKKDYINDWLSGAISPTYSFDTYFQDKTGYQLSGISPSTLQT